MPPILPLEPTQDLYLNEIYQFWIRSIHTLKPTQDLYLNEDLTFALKP